MVSDYSRSFAAAVCGLALAMACGGRSGDLLDGGSDESGFGTLDTDTDSTSGTGGTRNVSSMVSNTSSDTMSSSDSSAGGMAQTTATTSSTLTTGVVPFGGAGGSLFGGEGGMFFGMGGATVTNTTGMAGATNSTTTGMAGAGGMVATATTGRSTTGGPVTTGVSTTGFSTTGSVTTGSSTTGGVTPNPVQCFGCITRECPYFVECFQEDQCSEGLSCTFSECLGADIDCVIDCYDGDVVAAGELVVGLLCINSSCSDPCGIGQ